MPNARPFCGFLPDSAKPSREIVDGAGRIEYTENKKGTLCDSYPKIKNG